LGRRRQLTAIRLDRREVLLMVKRRARLAGLGERICNHTFRATNITAYLEGSGTVDVNQPYCLHYQIYPGLLF
jgi:integrase/recombinase XerD